jgi:nucleoside-diphosphate-sugar epimerase
MILYKASKMLANNASWDFKNKVKPHFALVTIHPAFVYGHNVLQTTAEDAKGTNGALFATIMTGQALGNITAVHVKDVAEAHIKALDDRVPDGSKYLLSGNKASWKDVVNILKKDYPGVPFKLAEGVEGDSWAVDTTRAETELGIKWRSLSSIVHEVMDQQLAFQKDI